jgi:hypothetical protein
MGEPLYILPKPEQFDSITKIIIPEQKHKPGFSQQNKACIGFKDFYHFFVFIPSIVFLSLSV